MKKTIFDHVAIGTRTLKDGWQLFGGLLGGAWVYGGDSPGYWWGQLRFGSGPKIELLTPTSPASPTARSSSASWPRAALGRTTSPSSSPTSARPCPRARARGIEPVGVDLSNDAWKEAFLHPRDAYGVVIQVAEQSATPSSHRLPTCQNPGRPRHSKPSSTA